MTSIEVVVAHSDHPDRWAEWHRDPDDVESYLSVHHLYQKKLQDDVKEINVVQTTNQWAEWRRDPDGLKSFHHSKEEKEKQVTRWWEGN